MSDNDVQRLPFGADDLRLPDALRGPLRKHLAALKANYLKRGWGMRVGWGERPALIVIDMARYWLDPELQIGSNLDSVMEGTCQVLAAARPRVRLHAVHVDHGLRGAESDGDVRFCERLCAGLGVGLTVRRVLVHYGVGETATS